jgi:uncharacterized protein (TIGR03437 family)
VTAVPTQVRAEGITERVGDIILQCSGSNPGAVLAGNLSVYLPVSVTNRVDSSNQTQDAVLSVDYGSGFVPSGVPGQVTGSMITFNGISFKVPPSGNLNIRISNIRADVYQGGTLSPQPVFAQLAFSTPSSIPIDQSRLVVAYPHVGLYTSLYDTGITCTGSPLPSTITVSDLFAAGTAFASTRVTEGFALAFQPRSAGEDNGTRFLVTYSGFPANAHVYVPDLVAGSTALVPGMAGDLGGTQQAGQYQPGSGTLLLARVFGADATGTGGSPAPLPSNTLVLNGANEVTLSGGSGYVVYEVIDANPARQETAQFPTFIGLSDLTGASLAHETISFAPVSSTLSASAGAPVPRFAALPTTPSDCSLLGDCGANYFPQLTAPTTPIALTAVAGGVMTGANGYIPVNNTGGGLMNWTATVSYLSGAGWLNLSPASGQNHNSIIVTANAKNLTAGTYQANIILNGGSAGNLTVPVTLTVAAAPAPPPPPPTPSTPAVVVSKVVNAATFDATPLVAGSLGTVVGSHLSGKSVTVTFDGSPANLLYVSDTQINLQVPLQVIGKTSAVLVVTADGVSSSPTTVVLAPAWPSVFANGVLNQDNTVNAPGTPAAAGSVLQIFATGIPAGAIVSARIGSHDNLIPLYAGDAPTVPGVQQVNVAVPDDLPPSSTQLVICAATAGQQYCSAAAPLATR